MKATLIEAIEGYYLTRCVFFLHRSGILRALVEGRDIPSLSAALGYDASLIEDLLRYVAARSNVMEYPYQSEPEVRPEGCSDGYLEYHLGKYVGAYGLLIDDLQKVLSFRTETPPPVDVRQLGAALLAVAEIARPPAADVIVGTGVRSLVDLGCGPGSLLTTLAREDTQFRGAGVDASAHMCDLAREACARTGVSDRVLIVKADAFDIPAWSSAFDTSPYEAIHMGSLLNAVARTAMRDVPRFLVQLRHIMPSRTVFITDYYGKLRHAGAEDSSEYRLTYLQDLAQSLSGQGIPPPTLSDWKELYEKAGSSFKSAFRGDAEGLEWFVHVISL